MPETARHEPGSFCWIELGTNDAKAAKAFYGALFGWTFKDDPMGPEAFYTTTKLGGKEVGGLYEYDAAQKKSGLPPHWLTYVAVANADEVTAKAKSLGANLMMEPFDVMDFGRMALLQDPQGATFAVWQAKSHPGSRIKDETGTYGWNELSTTDDVGARDFYTKLFGWGAKASTDAGMAYTEWQNGGTSIGGCLKLDPAWGPVPPHWLVYFMVDDCDASAAKTASLGGSVRVPPMDIPNVGRFAVLADPTGAAFAIIRLKT
jgi:hypothetical protein